MSFGRSVLVVLLGWAVPGSAFAQDFQYLRTATTSLTIVQSGAYNSDRGVVSMFAFNGAGQEFTIDGIPNGTTMSAPPTASGTLDGADYDPLTQRVLLLTQNCLLTEVDATTYTSLSTANLSGSSICAGLALGRDNRLYVLSYGTNEVVSYVRSGSVSVGRFSLAPLGISGADGIARIYGSNRFVVVSSTLNTAAVVTSTGGVVRTASPIGMPPLEGRTITVLDGLTGICANSHVWVCQGYGSRCLDFQPVTGDQNRCGCHEPQGLITCGGTAPICDDATNLCRPCQAGDCQAPTSICDPVSGACVEPPTDAGVALDAIVADAAPMDAVATDTGAADRGAADTGSGFDAGTPADAQASTDTGPNVVDAGLIPENEDGCGCSAAPRATPGLSGALAFWVGIGVALGVRRRRSAA